MNSPACFDIHPNHPLAGLEGWPATGPVYGLAEDEPPPARTIWARMGEIWRKAPDERPSQLPNTRIWY